VCERWRDAKLDLHHSRLTAVREGLKLASLVCVYSRCGEALFEEMITIPNVFIYSSQVKQKEMIRDATTGCGELDLVGVGTHKGMLA
jgi:hypothetical protein